MVLYLAERELVLSHLLSKADCQGQRLSESYLQVYVLCQLKCVTYNQHVIGFHHHQQSTIVVFDEMGRMPCCSKQGIKREAWTAHEDKILTKYIKINGEGRGISLPIKAGPKRSRGFPILSDVSKETHKWNFHCSPSQNKNASKRRKTYSRASISMVDIVGSGAEKSSLNGMCIFMLATLMAKKVVEKAVFAVGDKLKAMSILPSEMDIMTVEVHEKKVEKEIKVIMERPKELEDECKEDQHPLLQEWRRRRSHDGSGGGATTADGSSGGSAQQQRRETAVARRPEGRQRQGAVGSGGSGATGWTAEQAAPASGSGGATVVPAAAR
ncbi:hypothetical protein Scep_012097 [Stephania cephalantha]|uniref:Uncharacterized protein n=1 Tax=Stephania cephalantha TaxID=152367 RepID=A0AAP0JEH3_9MAGN